MKFIVQTALFSYLKKQLKLYFMFYLVYVSKLEFLYFY